MSLPLSQDVPFLYSGSVTCASTTQMINAITGMMLKVGWTQSGADGVLRSYTDEQGRFFEMEVLQNTNPALSHQLQFAVYKRTKAEDNNVLSNRGIQLSTGNIYKIHVNAFGVYCERNFATSNNGQGVWAWQLYANPVGSGLQSAALLAGGHRDYGGTAGSTAGPMSTAATYWGGPSGAAGGGNDFFRDNFTVSSWSYFRGGRAFVMEDWMKGPSEGIIGRPYCVLIAGINDTAGFDLPSGTGSLTYVKMNCFDINGQMNICIRSV